MEDDETTIDLSRYSSLGDFRLDVEAEKEGGRERGGGGGGDGSLVFCFWVYLLNSTTAFPCTIFRQVEKSRRFSSSSSFPFAVRWFLIQGTVFISQFCEFSCFERLGWYVFSVWRLF